eukprot:1142890-Ditylum_brightwellii.AAC.1
MIEKFLGNHKIHKLCVIHIYEADIAIDLEVIWCKLVAAAEARHNIHPGQHGDCKGKDAQTLTLMEELNTIFHTHVGRTLLALTTMQHLVMTELFQVLQV